MPLLATTLFTKQIPKNAMILVFQVSVGIYVYVFSTTLRKILSHGREFSFTLKLREK